MGVLLDGARPGCILHSKPSTSGDNETSTKTEVVSYKDLYFTSNFLLLSILLKVLKRYQHRKIAGKAEIKTNQKQENQMKALMSSCNTAVCKNHRELQHLEVCQQVGQETRCLIKQVPPEVLGSGQKSTTISTSSLQLLQLQHAHFQIGNSIHYPYAKCQTVPAGWKTVGALSDSLKSMDYNYIKSYALPLPFTVNGLQERGQPFPKMTVLCRSQPVLQVQQRSAHSCHRHTSGSFSGSCATCLAEVTADTRMTALGLQPLPLTLLLPPLPDTSKRTTACSARNIKRSSFLGKASRTALQLNTGTNQPRAIHKTTPSPYGRAPHTSGLAQGSWQGRFMSSRVYAVTECYTEQNTRAYRPNSIGVTRGGLQGAWSHRAGRGTSSAPVGKALRLTLSASAALIWTSTTGGFSKRGLQNFKTARGKSDKTAQEHTGQGQPTDAKSVETVRCAAYSAQYISAVVLPSRRHPQALERFNASFLSHSVNVEQLSSSRRESPKPTERAKQSTQALQKWCKKHSTHTGQTVLASLRNGKTQEKFAVPCLTARSTFPEANATKTTLIFPGPAVLTGCKDEKEVAAPHHAPTPGLSPPGQILCASQRRSLAPPVPRLHTLHHSGDDSPHVDTARGKHKLRGFGPSLNFHLVSTQSSPKEWYNRAEKQQIFQLYNVVWNGNITMLVSLPGPEALESCLAQPDTAITKQDFQVDGKPVSLFLLKLSHRGFPGATEKGLQLRDIGSTRHHPAQPRAPDEAHGSASPPLVASASHHPARFDPIPRADLPTFGENPTVTFNVRRDTDLMPFTSHGLSAVITLQGRCTEKPLSSPLVGIFTSSIWGSGFRGGQITRLLTAVLISDEKAAVGATRRAQLSAGSIHIPLRLATVGSTPVILRLWCKVLWDLRRRNSMQKDQAVLSSGEFLSWVVAIAAIGAVQFMVMHVIADQTVTAFASMEKSHFWKLWGVFLDTEVETRRRSQHPVISPQVRRSSPLWRSKGEAGEQLHVMALQLLFENLRWGQGPHAHVFVHRHPEHTLHSASEAFKLPDTPFALERKQQHRTVCTQTGQHSVRGAKAQLNFITRCRPSHQLVWEQLRLSDLLACAPAPRGQGQAKNLLCGLREAMGLWRKEGGEGGCEESTCHAHQDTWEQQCSLAAVRCDETDDIRHTVRAEQQQSLAVNTPCCRPAWGKARFQSQCFHRPLKWTPKAPGLYFLRQALCRGRTPHPCSTGACLEEEVAAGMTQCLLESLGTSPSQERWGFCLTALAQLVNPHLRASKHVGQLQALHSTVPAQWAGERQGHVLCAEPTPDPWQRDGKNYPSCSSSFAPCSGDGDQLDNHSPCLHGAPCVWPHGPLLLLHVLGQEEACCCLSADSAGRKQEGEPAAPSVSLSTSRTSSPLAQRQARTGRAAGRESLSHAAAGVLKKVQILFWMQPCRDLSLGEAGEEPARLAINDKALAPSLQRPRGGHQAAWRGARRAQPILALHREAASESTAEAAIQDVGLRGRNAGLEGKKRTPSYSLFSIAAHEHPSKHAECFALAVEVTPPIALGHLSTLSPPPGQPYCPHPATFFSKYCISEDKNETKILSVKPAGFKEWNVERANFENTYLDRAEQQHMVQGPAVKTWAVVHAGSRDLALGGRFGLVMEQQHSV
ncbi:hypothetical protein Anapl_14039 [Anas platyrhynchos]|uniref:Uncharacterized protein n=1 Tax=Anas platyrhynchos TaxID=8839 RepID=R0LDJ0_ANAPL|nr:hypothetical protein Anapl_14039 [Anas platyrhynchos]